MDMRPGISFSARSISFLPHSAREISLTLCGGLDDCPAPCVCVCVCVGVTVWDTFMLDKKTRRVSGG